MPTMELPPTPLPGGIRDADSDILITQKRQDTIYRQFLRFGFVGCLNTLIDLLVLNGLLWLWPTQNTSTLLFYNSLAYAFGALNSFFLNRHWTFRLNGHTNPREVARFVLTTLAGIVCNDLILWGLSSVLRPAQLNPTLWTNLAKVTAIGGTLLISYLGMRLWVFVLDAHRGPLLSGAAQGKKGDTQHAAGYVYQKESANTMRDTPHGAVKNRPDFVYGQESGLLPRLWHKLALGAVLLTSVFMNFYQLGQNGFGNLFYAAGVRSMTDNLHNFFFVSYDPGGFVTIDKPPLGFWLQAISVKLFGFTPFSIFLPQALAGVLAVLVLFFLVRRHFGVTAALLAALALALSPLSVVTARNNTIDTTLALTLLLGAWATMRAAETGKWRWLLLSAVLVGLGFNVKMLEAYLVVPAFGLLYLLASPRRLRVRLGQLLVATIVLLAISFSWAMVVDLTPASQRPYVGSSQDNSEIGLALGYNGIDRVFGRFGIGGGGHGNNAQQSRVATNNFGKKNTSGNSNAATSNSANDESRVAGEIARNWGMDRSSPSPLRLFTEPIGGQISWLLPIALLGMLALIWQRRPRFQRDRQQQSLLLWGTWLLSMGVFFSISSFFHQYYMVTLAPAIGALFGIGLVVMWQDYQRAGWRGWLLPLALLATAAEQIFFILSNPAWGTWLIPCIAVPCLLAALVLSMARVLAQQKISSHVLAPVLSLGVVALLLTPAVWSAMPGLQNTANETPVAGPVRHFDFGGFANRLNTTNPALISYLESHQGDAKYLVATLNSMSADGIILATNQPVMAMGGFMGADPILTTNQLTSLVNDGTVRYFLLYNPSLFASFFGTSHSEQSGTTSTRNAEPQRPLGFFGRSFQSGLSTWVTQHCATVPTSTWQPAPSGSAGNITQLYDCAQEK